MNRREFLSLLPLGGLALASSLRCANSQGGQVLKGKSVLVVGAGMAGLAAASELQKLGASVVVLEARDRVGGRIHSLSHNGLTLDMGAAWIHGVRGNPLTQLARQARAKTTPTSYDDAVLYDLLTGKRIPDGQAWRGEELFDEAFERAQERAEELDEDQSIFQSLQQDKKSQRLQGLEKRGFDFAATAFESTQGADLREMSVWYTEADDAFDGEDHLFPKGFAQLTALLAQGLDIRLGEPVKEIHHAPRMVRLLTAKNTHQADAAVITLPLGLLKAGIPAFTPKLPREKMASIQKLGYGVLNKAVITFPAGTRFPFDELWLGLLDGKKGFYSEYLNLAPLLGQPVLVHLAGGTDARRLEGMPLAQLQQELTQVLKRAFPGLPAPESILRTQWTQDPFAFGAYSYFAPHSTPDDVARVAQPVGQSLFFAGEATAIFRENGETRLYPGTVHGAYLSGLREAKRIAQMLGAGTGS